MRIPASFVSPLLYQLTKLWFHSLQYTEEGREAVDDLFHTQKTPPVFALWHDELFPLLHLVRDLQVVTVVSQSNDGELLAQVLGRLGFATARGSSSRGGVKALLKASRLMRKGYCGAVSVDGPRGPRHKVKEGAIFLANRTPAKIVPTRVFMSNAKVFEKAWDKFQLPYPFSSVRIVFGEPYAVSEGKLDTETMAMECAKLKVKLEELQ